MYGRPRRWVDGHASWLAAGWTAGLVIQRTGGADRRTGELAEWRTDDRAVHGSWRVDGGCTGGRRGGEGASRYVIIWNLGDYVRRVMSCKNLGLCQEIISRGFCSTVSA